MKNQKKKITDTKLHIKVYIISVITGFTIPFCVLTILSMKEDSVSTMSLKLRLIISAAAAIPMALLMFWLTKVTNKQDKIYTAIIEEFKTDSFSDHVLAQMEEQLQFCINSGGRYDVYLNNYAMFLTDAYTELREFDRAKYFINCVRYATLTKELKELNTITAHQHIVYYHALRVQLAIHTNEQQYVERLIQDGKPFFDKYYGKSDFITLIIDFMWFDYYLMNGRFSDCEAILKKHEENENIACTLVGRKAMLLRKQGRSEEAEKAFDEAYSLAKNDYLRREIAIERSCPSF